MSTSPFRYFASPHQFSTYAEELQQCQLCGRVRAGYKGPYYGVEHIDFVCEECLIVGRLADKNQITNEGDLEALQTQLKQRYPELTAEEVAQLAQQRTEELERRTPNLLTWQDWFWPAHCGDYCRFIKEVGKPDLVAIANDRDGKGFFRDHAVDVDVSNMDAIWSAIRPDSPVRHTESYSVGVYLFQCLECNQHVIIWDCD
jgi:uncharacterized protein CbrC (UPF0167 family)